MQSLHSNKLALRNVLLVTEKNMKVYANKPPVLIFGLLFPLFMFLSFYLGRRIDFQVFFPGLLGMSLFFLSTSVGPLITPWEKMTRTYERLLSFPITVGTVIYGNVLTGIVFGLVLTSIPLGAGLALLPYKVNAVVLIIGLLVGTPCFSSLGVLLSSPNAPNPSYIMILSSLIRFPLIFISGIFVPLERLSGVTRALSYTSPVTYLVDIVNYSLKGDCSINPLVDFLALLAFTTLFVFLAYKIHRRNMIKGI
jgi:ABC-2 type transport system permease protein